MLGVAGLRGVLGLLAIPLAAALWQEHFVLVVLLRPTKEVLLAGGFLSRQHDVALVSVVAAGLPLLLGGVWLFFLIGRQWAPDLERGGSLPRWARRITPRKQLDAMSKLLDEKGMTVVFLGRLAVFPSSIVAAAAGTSGMATHRFLIADGLGALVSMAEVVGVGYLLGEQYHSGRKWITAAGAAVLLVLLVIVGRWLRRQSGRGT